MTYTQLAYLHLATVIPAFFIGALQLLRRKGTPIHKLLGKIYMILMLARFIYIFSFLALFSVPTAYFAACRGNIRVHRYAMISLYVGGILIAGAFAFSPGRMLHEWLFG